MKKDDVIVALSTYNGEKYIEKMLDSILNQTYKNVKIYIRDDNSSDNTSKILKKYEKEHNNIKVIYGKENLGYPECFYKVMSSLQEAKYYFFADQDDVWKEDKISRAVDVLNSLDNNKACAYYCGYYICDKDLNIINKSKIRKNNIKFKDTLFEVCGLEFTMAINHKALELLNKYRPVKSKARGTWMSMLYSSNGIVYFDNYHCAYYRRHEKSVTSNKLSGLGMWKWRIKKFLVNDNFKDYRGILEEFSQVLNKKLCAKDRKTLNFFLKKGFLHNIKKCLYPKRLRTKFVDEIGLRIMFLIGKI